VQTSHKTFKCVIKISVDSCVIIGDLHQTFCTLVSFQSISHSVIEDHLGGELGWFVSIMQLYGVVNLRS